MPRCAFAGVTASQTHKASRHADRCSCHRDCRPRQRLDALAIADDAIILHGKQLFIDDYLIAELNRTSKTLNQPVKHPSNPLLHKHDREYAMAYGVFQKDWDWGQGYPHHAILVVGDEIRSYYTGISRRHWDTYHKDESDHAVGLATLRLDGFVSVEAGTEGALITKPLIILGDTLVVNANAEGGSLVVEVVDSQGKVVAGFAAEDCIPITTDSVRHIVIWKENIDCHLLQDRPIRLRFHLKQSKLYSFESTTRHNHCLQFYDWELLIFSTPSPRGTGDEVSADAWSLAGALSCVRSAIRQSDPPFYCLWARYAASAFFFA